MLTTLFSFLGGGAFRLIFGQIVTFLNNRQEHEHELAMQRLQSELDTARHQRDMERVRLQSDLNVKEIVVQADAAEQQVMANAFLEAVKGTRQKTGVLWVDAWNASIRPAGASLSLLVWLISIAGAAIAASHLPVLSEFDKTLISAFLGIFVGDRIHSKLQR